MHKALDEPIKAQAKRERSGFFLAVRLLLGLAIIVFLIWRTDLSGVLTTLTSIDRFWLAMAFVVQIIAKLVWAWRWSVLMQIFEVPTPFSRLVKGIYVGLFFGNFLPTSFGGDLYRGYWVLKDRKLYPKSMFIVFTERFIGFACLGYIALPACLLLLQSGVDLWSIQLPLLLILAGLCGSILALHPGVFAFFNHLLFRPDSNLLAGLRNKITQALQTLHEAGTKRWKVYLLSMGVHLAGVLFFYCLGRGLGLPLEAWHYFVIVPLTVVATLLPISFNGLGVREGALVLLTAALGATVLPAQAIALGLMSSIVILAISLIGGGFYIMGERERAYVS